MSDNKEKRNIGNTGYEIKHSFWIGNKEILLAENMNADDGHYLVAQFRERSFIGEYSRAEASDDYLETLQAFTERIQEEVAALQAERDARNLPCELFTSEHCYPYSYGDEIANKVIAIKASVISPEYRRGETQLVYATHGNGTGANARGSAVYCYHLNNGEHTRFERQEVLGVIRDECIPVWAKESLVRIQAQISKPAAEKEFAGNYEITERIEVGQKVFVLGHCERAANPYGTWQGYKNSKGSFDWGHYHDDYDSAKADLRERAASEQQRLGRGKRDERDNR
jgi:hypothetical protein